MGRTLRMELSSCPHCPRIQEEGRKEAVIEIGGEIQRVLEDKLRQNIKEEGVIKCQALLLDQGDPSLGLPACRSLDKVISMDYGMEMCLERVQVRLMGGH